jgi:glycosyltransferase involved in cell wall biosynthesis
MKDTVIDGETGVLVEPAAPDELAKAMTRLLLDRELRRCMGRQARMRAELIVSRKTLGSQLANAYDALVAS